MMRFSPTEQVAGCRGAAITNKNRDLLQASGNGS